MVQAARTNAAAKVNAIAQALDKVLNTVADRVANPARVSDPDRLRGAVGG
ncbi:epimerase, partial [Mycobacterium avium subsp. hominissuis]|nr:epimerase [Mycobacterium avium subsp. hominissuis]